MKLTQMTFLQILISNAGPTDFILKDIVVNFINS